MDREQIAKEICGYINSNCKLNGNCLDCVIYFGQKDSNEDNLINWHIAEIENAYDAGYQQACDDNGILTGKDAMDFIARARANES